MNTYRNIANCKYGLPEWGARNKAFLTYGVDNAYNLELPELFVALKEANRKALAFRLKALVLLTLLTWVAWSFEYVIVGTLPAMLIMAYAIPGSISALSDYEGFKDL